MATFWDRAAHSVYRMFSLYFDTRILTEESVVESIMAMCLKLPAEPSFCGRIMK